MVPGRALSKAAETASRGRMGPSPTCTQDMFPDFWRVSLFSEGKCCDGQTRALRWCLLHHKRLRNIGLYCDACLLLQGRSPLPSYVFLPTTSHKLLPKPGLEGAGSGTHKVHSPGRSCQGLSGYSTRPGSWAHPVPRHVSQNQGEARAAPAEAGGPGGGELAEGYLALSTVISASLSPPAKPSPPITPNRADSPATVSNCSDSG